MMRAIALPFVLVAAMVPIAACSASWSDDGKPGIAPSGSGGERHYAVADFDKVALGAAGDVEIRTGQSFGLTVTGAPADLDTLKVTRDGDTLGLGRKSGNWGSSGPIHWVVTMPRIAEANIGGSGTMGIDHVDGGQFDGNIGGSGTLSVNGLRVDKASFAIGGSGTIHAAGTANALSLSIGGSGKLLAQPLVAQTADVSIAGAGNIEATVKQTADINIVGAGDAVIAGGAKCSVTKLGAGNVRCV